MSGNSHPDTPLQVAVLGIVTEGLCGMPPPTPKTILGHYEVIRGLCLHSAKGLMVWPVPSGMVRGTLSGKVATVEDAGGRGYTYFRNIK